MKAFKRYRVIKNSGQKKTTPANSHEIAPKSIPLYSHGSKMYRKHFSEISISWQYPHRYTPLAEK